MAKLLIPVADNVTSFTASIWFQLDNQTGETPVIFSSETAGIATLSTNVFAWISNSCLLFYANQRRIGLPLSGYSPTTIPANSLVQGWIPALFAEDDSIISQPVADGEWRHALISFDGTGSHTSGYLSGTQWMFSGNPSLWKCVLNGVNSIKDIGTSLSVSNPDQTLGLTGYGGPLGTGGIPQLLSDQTATTTADTTAGDSNALHFGSRPAWYEAILAKGQGTPTWASMSGTTIAANTHPIVPWESNGDMHVEPGHLNPLTPAGTVVTFHDVQDPQLTWSETNPFVSFYAGDDFVLGGYHKIRYGDVQVYFNQALNVTSASVLGKFVKIAGGIGTPQDPRVAATAFGPPDILLRGNHSSFPTNLGTGGATSVVGTITDFTPTPTY